MHRHSLARTSAALTGVALVSAMLAGCGPLDSGSSATEIPAGELPAKVEKLAGTISSQQFGSVLVRGNYVTFTYQSGKAWKSAGGPADGEVANEQDEDDLPHYKPVAVSGLGLQKLASSMEAVDCGSDKKAGRVESSPTGALVTSVGCEASKTTYKQTFVADAPVADLADLTSEKDLATAFGELTAVAGPQTTTVKIFTTADSGASAKPRITFDAAAAGDRGCSQNVIRYAATKDAEDEPILSLEDCGKPADGLKAFDLSTVDQTKLQAAMAKAASGVGASSPKDVESFWLLSRDGKSVVVQALKGTKQAGVAIG